MYTCFVQNNNCKLKDKKERKHWKIKMSIYLFEAKNNNKLLISRKITRIILQAMLQSDVLNQPNTFFINQWFKNALSSLSQYLHLTQLIGIVL